MRFSSATIHYFRLTVLSLGYFLAGQASFMVSVSHGIVTQVVFAAEGFGLGFVILYGYRMWPGIFVGQLALALNNGLALGPALGVSAVNSLEVILAAFLYKKFHLSPALDRLRDVIGLFLLVFIVFQPFSATMGVSLLCASGVIPWVNWGSSWGAWWFGNGLGQILVTPFFLSFMNLPRNAKIAWGKAALIGFLIVPTCWYFIHLIQGSSFALVFAVLTPVLVLAAVWGGMTAATLGNCMVAIIALVVTRLGRGPFVVDEISQILELNIFLLGSAFTSQFIAVLFDERRRSKNALQRYVDIIDKYVITSSTDTNGVITGSSEAFSRISGFSKAELLGKQHNIVRHPDTPPSFYQNMWDTLQRGEIWMGELKNLSKSGQVYWVKGSIEPNRGEDGSITGYTSIRQDITDKKRIEELSVKDHLTQIYNRMKLDECLQLEISRADRYSRPLSIILIDIDHFKKVNDSFGHQIGDQVLVQVAKLLKKNVRDADIPGRWGGEEFLVICPETELIGVQALAEKLRQAVQDFIFPEVGSKTISLGVAARANDESDFELVRRADEAMYKAKNQGRNQVVSSIQQAGG